MEEMKRFWLFLSQSIDCNANAFPFEREREGEGEKLFVLLTTLECARTIGNANALTTTPMVIKTATSFVEDVFEYESVV